MYKPRCRCYSWMVKIQTTQRWQNNSMQTEEGFCGEQKCYSAKIRRLISDGVVWEPKRNWNVYSDHYCKIRHQATLICQCAIVKMTSRVKKKSMKRGQVEGFGRSKQTNLRSTETWRALSCFIFFNIYIFFSVGDRIDWCLLTFSQLISWAFQKGTFLWLKSKALAV